MAIFSKFAISNPDLWSELKTSLADNKDSLRIIGGSVLATLFAVKLYQLYDDDKLNFKTLIEQSFKLLVRLPVVSGIAAKELSDVDKTIANQFRKIFDSQVFVKQLPQIGRTSVQLMEDLKNYGKIGKIDWRNGRASGTVYSDANKDLSKLMSEVYDLTAYTNPLHPDVFPGINKMEAEVVRITCNLFNGDDDSCGTTTTGGTESIILAVKAYRDYGLEAKGIAKAEIVVPVTAHAAFQKATQMLKMKVRFIETDPTTGKVNLKAMNSAINSNTVLLVGSAPNYPHGIIDDIEGIAQLGLKYSIPVHVDCCLGSFLVPFMAAAGYPIPKVDFAVAGVTSISADTHKYGYAPKGSSVIMYSNKKYRKHQYSVQTDWPGGIYATPTLGGSRCGANIATCWATLLHFGHEGYVDATRKIIEKQRYLKSELSKLHGIRIMGDPIMSVIAIESDDFNIFRLSDKMSEMGWSLNPLQFPSALHICMTLMHVQPGVTEAFLRDLKIVLAECLKTPKSKGDGIGVVYGMAQSLPDRSMVSDIASAYIDGLFTTDWPQTNGK